MLESIDVVIEYTWYCPHCGEKSWEYRIPAPGDEAQCQTCAAMFQINSVTDGTEEPSTE